MGQSLVQNYMHIIFSTKKREPWFRSTAVRERLHAYLAGACRNLNSPAFQVGGFEDHVHIFCNLSKNMALKDFVMCIKKESSKWAKHEFNGFQGFHWQAGYGGFSISPSHVGPLKQYIQTQAEHHKEESFQEELRRLFRLYGIEYDENYVWD